MRCCCCCCWGVYVCGVGGFCFRCCCGGGCCCAVDCNYSIAHMATLASLRRRSCSGIFSVKYVDKINGIVMVAAFQLLLIYSFISLFYVRSLFIFFNICIPIGTCVYISFGQVLELCGRLLRRAFAFAALFLWKLYFIFFFFCYFFARTKHVFSLFLFRMQRQIQIQCSFRLRFFFIRFFMRRFTLIAMFSLLVLLLLLLVKSSFAQLQRLSINK